MTWKINSIGQIHAFLLFNCEEVALGCVNKGSGMKLPRLSPKKGNLMASFPPQKKIKKIYI